MKKRFVGTYIAVAVLAVLGLVVYWMQGRPGNETATSQPAAVLNFDPEEVSALEWERPAEPRFVRLERTGGGEGEAGGWRMSEPVAWPADQEEVAALLEEAASLDPEARYDDVDPEEFGTLDPVLTFRLIAGDGAERTIRLGNAAPVGAGRYAQVDGDEAVFLLGAEAVLSLDRMPVDLRDKRIVPWELNDVNSLQIMGEQGLLALERDEEGWLIKEPYEDRADAIAVHWILLEIIHMAAEDFVDEPFDPAEYGMDEPLATVALSAGDGPSDETQVLYVGQHDFESGYFIARADQRGELEGTLFHVRDEAYRFPYVGPSEVLHAFIFAEAWPESIESLVVAAEDSEYRLEKESGGWTFEWPGGRKTGLEDGDVFYVFAGLRAIRLDRMKAPHAGLDGADWTIRMTLRGGEELEMAVAAEEPGDWTAAVSGRPHLYSVQSDRLQTLQERLGALTNDS